MLFFSYFITDKNSHNYREHQCLNKADQKYNRNIDKYCSIHNVVKLMQRNQAKNEWKTKTDRRTMNATIYENISTDNNQAMIHLKKIKI